MEANLQARVRRDPEWRNAKGQTVGQERTAAAFAKIEANKGKKYAGANSKNNRRLDRLSKGIRY
jgi:hypothetical protein